MRLADSFSVSKTGCIFGRQSLLRSAVTFTERSEKSRMIRTLKKCYFELPKTMNCLNDRTQDNLIIPEINHVFFRVSAIEQLSPANLK